MSILNTESVWNQYGTGVKRYISKFIRNRAIADDLSQDVFIKVHKSLDQLTHPDRVSSWVFRITNNTVIDYLRKSNPEYSLDSDPGQERAEDSPEILHHLAKGIPLFLMQLPEKYRQAIILSDLQGRPQKEVASTLNLSLSGAKSRIQRGRKLLYNAYLDCCDFEVDSRNTPIGFTPRHIHRTKCEKRGSC